MNATIKNRIVEHVTVRAGDLIPHPLNFREHPDDQRQALAASYAEIGFARSLLGYRLADGRIQLIDGHLRAELDPDMPVTVEVLDVTEDEARQLLLTMDPLAGLARTNEETHERLRQITATRSTALANLWKTTASAARDVQKALQKAKKKTAGEPEATAANQFLVLIECVDEHHQVELLTRFKAEGMTCKALIS